MLWLYPDTSLQSFFFRCIFQPSDISLSYVSSSTGWSWKERKMAPVRWNSDNVLLITREKIHTMHWGVIPHIPRGVVVQDVECSEYRVARPHAPKRSSQASPFTCPVGECYINVISSKGRGRTDESPTWRSKKKNLSQNTMLIGTCNKSAWRMNETATATWKCTALFAAC